MKSECRRRARASRSPSPNESVDEDCIRHHKAHRPGAASRKDDGIAHALSRRPAWFWAEFNQWWREEQARLGKRPGKPSITQWYKKNANTVWQQDTPTFKETRLHAKCLRTTEAVREYFRRYRAARKEQQQQLKDGSSGGGACDDGATPYKGHPRPRALGPHAHGHHPHSATAAEEPPMDTAALIAEHNRRIFAQQQLQQQQQQAQGHQPCWWQPPGVRGPQLQAPPPQAGVAAHNGSPSAATVAAALLPVAAIAPTIAPNTAPALGGAGGVYAGADVCVHGWPHQHPYQQQEEQLAGCGSQRQAKVADANSAAPQYMNLAGPDLAPIAAVPIRSVVVTTALQGPAEVAKAEQPTTDGTSNVPYAEGPDVAAPPPLLTDPFGCASPTAPAAHASGRSPTAALLAPAAAPAPCAAAAVVTNADAATGAGGAAAAAPIAACFDDTASGEDEGGSLRSRPIEGVGAPSDGGASLPGAERGRGSMDGCAPCGSAPGGQDAVLGSSAGAGDAAGGMWGIEAGESRQLSAGGGSTDQDCSGTDLDDEGRCSPLPPSWAERLYRPPEHNQHQHRQHQHQQLMTMMMQQGQQQEQQQEQQQSQPWQAESEQQQQQQQHLRLWHLQQLLWPQTAHPVWQRLQLQLPQQRPLPPTAALWPSSTVAAATSHNTSYDSLIGVRSGPGSGGLVRMQPLQASAFVHSGRTEGLGREGEQEQGPLRLIPTPSMPCARPTMAAALMAPRGMLPAWQEADEMYDNDDDDNDGDDSCVPELFWD